MSAMTNYLENRLIDHLFRAQTLAAPSGLHVALHTADPTETGAVAEVTGNGYTRGALAPSLTNWRSTNGTTGSVSTGTGGATANAAAISFPTPTGAGWGAVTHFSIWDAGTGGNCLFYGALTSSKTINSGDTVSAAIDAITVTLA
jgi:hypothetical protein